MNCNSRFIAQILIAINSIGERKRGVFGKAQVTRRGVWENITFCCGLDVRGNWLEKWIYLKIERSGDKVFGCRTNTTKEMALARQGSWS